MNRDTGGLQICLRFNDRAPLRLAWYQKIALAGSTFINTYMVSQKNCSTFDKILKNKDNVNKIMER